MPRTTTIENLVCDAQTEKALLLRRHDVDEADAEEGVDMWWVPRSLIEDTDITDIGDVGEIEVQAWFAEQEGLDDD